MALTDDQRFVIMMLNPYVVYWQQGILVGHDYWARVDVFIAKRLSGEIERVSSVEYTCDWRTTSLL
jgi:hypothetical protein